MLCCGCGQQLLLGGGDGKYLVRRNAGVLETRHKPALLPEAVKSLSQFRIGQLRCRRQIDSRPLCFCQHGDDGLLCLVCIQAGFEADGLLFGL